MRSKYHHRRAHGTSLHSMLACKLWVDYYLVSRPLDVEESTGLAVKICSQYKDRGSVLLLCPSPERTVDIYLISDGDIAMHYMTETPKEYGVCKPFLKGCK